MSSRRTIRFTDPEEGLQKIQLSGSFSSFFIHKHVKGVISKNFSTIQKELQLELSSNPQFAQVWEIAKNTFRSRKNTMPKLREECQIAIIAYTMDAYLYGDFNDKCRRMLSDSSWNSFPYKTFYTLLVRSIHDISSVPPATIKTYYRGMSHKVRNLKVGDHVFLKQFMSSTASLDTAKRFLGSEGTLITFSGSPLAACGIAALSDFPSEQEMLLFPWSVFKVVKIVPGLQQDNVYFETVESFVRDLPYSGNYKSKGVVVNNN